LECGSLFTLSKSQGRRFRTRALVHTVICLGAASGFAAAPRLPTAQEIDSIFSSLTSPTAPGVAVLVRKDDRVVFERGYGIRDLTTRAKIDATTNFRLASCTKQFTAMAVMLLVHDSKLAYDTRLAEIFPDFPEYGKSMTIRNLLNHTSGLQDYEDLMIAAETPRNTRLWTDTHQIQDSEVLKLLEQQVTTKFPPGTKWNYSSSGYVVLGLVVAKISGEPFGDFLRDRIFAPLKMQNTLAFEKGKNYVANRALGYTKSGRDWQESDQSPTSATLGDGGVYSSLADLAKWDNALRNHTLLSAAEMEPALTPVMVSGDGPRGPNAEPAAYGFGWFLHSFDGHVRMWHYGETVGFRTNIQRFTDDHLTIIVLCNRTDLNPGALSERVADLFFHPPH
jgi:CubicO group peptidase (beta-lactamase class C family)